MQLKDSRLLLSPSDVTGYLGCEHLTTLSLQVARGELVKPAAENEQAELVFRKGREHEAAYLARLRAEGKTVAEISLEPDLDWERAARETEEAIAAGVDVVYQGVLVDGRLARAVADFLERQAGRHLRGARHEARPQREARLHPPALLLQRAARARSRGATPERIHVLLGSGERQSFRPQEFAAYCRRVRARLEEFVADPAATRRRTRATTASICDFKPLCDAWWDEVDHLCRVAGVGRRQIEKLEPAGITTLAALARADRAAAGPQRRRRFAKLRDQAALQLRRARDRRARFELLQPQPAPASRSCPTRRPATSSSTSRATRSGTSEGSLEYLWGDPRRRRRTSRRSGPTTTRASGPRSSSSSTSSTRASRDHPDLHVYHYAAYEITALTPADGPLRHPRGRGRRPAPPRRLRRPAQGRARRPARLAAGLRAEGDGGLPRLRPRRPRSRTAAPRSSSSSTTCRRATTAILDAIAAYNRGGLRRDARSCATGCSSGAPRRSRGSGRSRRPSPRSRSRRRPRRSSAPRCARRCSTPARSSPRSCSTTTTASASRSGGRSSTGSSMTPEELVEDADSIGLLEPAGEPRAGRSGRSSTRFTFPPQEHKLGVGPATVRPGDRQARRRDRRARPRGARARAQARAEPRRACRCREALIPGGPYDTDDAGGRADAVRPLAARRRPPLPGARVGAAPRAVRPRTSRRPTSTR